MSGPTLRDAEALVGLPTVPGEFDCGHLARLAQERLFGRRLAWPAANGRHPRGARGRAAAIVRGRDQLTDRVAAPAAGDVVLFMQQVDGHEDWHIGTVLLHHGQQWVLHTNDHIKASVLEPLQRCRARGMHVEGFYRWRADVYE